MLLPDENRRILAVDDDPIILEIYRRMLVGHQKGGNPAADDLLAMLDGPAEAVAMPERPPYLLDTFSQGLDALEAVEESVRAHSPYAVALLDMRMPPGIDGLETAQRIRVVDSKVQIIIVTAYSDHGIDRIQRDLAGQVLWFRKPFEIEELYQAVRSSVLVWNQQAQLEHLQENLSWRVEQQTMRLQEKVQSMELLMQNSLSREQYMRELKRDNRWLRGYQDLRMMLSNRELAEPKPVDAQPAEVRLLLVDDSATVCAAYRQLLQEVGYLVETASSVEMGMQRAQESPPDLALVDYYMPDKNGDQLIVQLRHDHRTEKVLSLLFTNAGDEALAVQAGAIYWMHKDQSAEEFQQKMALVRDYIQQQKREEIGEEQKIASYTERRLEYGNHRVLLVDDEEENLLLLNSILGVSEPDAASQGLEALMQLSGSADTRSVVQEYSFEVVSASQGEEAIQRVEQAERSSRPFAVALIDMRMPPGIDGLETARQLRQISPQTQIVILTAYSDYRLQEIQQVLGMNFTFMTKPYQPEVILQRVIEGCDQWTVNRRILVSYSALLNLAEDMEQEILHRRQVEVQLEQASRTKDDFLSSMSHELRTPLTTMIGYNEVMAEEQEIPRPYREMAQSSLLAGRTLLQLVNDILDMSKIRAGKFELNEHPFDLSKVMQDVGELMNVFGSQKGVRINHSVSPALQQQPSALQSAEQCRQIQSGWGAGGFAIDAGKTTVSGASRYLSVCG
jgi:CheY-like chemotaxis protein